MGMYTYLVSAVLVCDLYSQPCKKASRTGISFGQRESGTLSGNHLNKKGGGARRDDF